MSNRLDMKKDTNNRKDKTKYDGPEKPDAYMGNDKQWVFRALVLAFVDMCIIAISFFFALMIRFEFSYSHIPLSFLEGYLHIVPLFMVISLVVFYIFRLYHSIWRFASINEFMHIIGAFLVLAVVSVTIHEVYEIKMPYAFWIIGLMLSFALCTACRFAYRFFRTGQKMLEQRGSANGDEKVMIIGAGNAGRMLIRELIMSSHLHTKACCIIDDNPAKLGRFIDGVPIVGNQMTFRRWLRSMISRKLCMLYLLHPVRTGRIYSIFVRTQAVMCLWFRESIRWWTEECRFPICAR